MQVDVLRVPRETGPLTIRRRGPDISDELNARGTSLRAFAKFIGVKHPDHARRIALGLTVPRDEDVRERIQKYLATPKACGLCKGTGKTPRLGELSVDELEALLVDIRGELRLRKKR